MKNIEPGSCAYRSTSQLREGCARHHVPRCVPRCALGVAAVAVVMLSLVLLPLPATAAESNDAVMAQIMRDWKARRTAMAQVHYVIKGTRMIPKGTMTEMASSLGRTDGSPVPRADVVDAVRMEMLFDFPHKRSRIEEEIPPLPGFEHDARALATSHVVEFHDGPSAQVWYPKASSDRVQLAVKQNAPFVRTFLRLQPILFAHGYVNGRMDAMPAPRDIPLDPAIFRVHSKVGTKVAVLRCSSASGWTEWEVDLSHRSAVVRMTSYIEDRQRTSELRISYRNTSHGWLPRSWQLAMFRGAGSQETVTELWKLTAVRINTEPRVTEASFRFVPKPGMIVRDRDTKRIYEVSTNGSPGRDFGAIVRERKIAEAREKQRWQRRATWIGLLGVGVLLLVCILSIRRKRRG